MEEELDAEFIMPTNHNRKTAIIRRSHNKNKEGVPVRKISEVVEMLENEGYEVYNYLSKDNN